MCKNVHFIAGFWFWFFFFPSDSAWALQRFGWGWLQRVGNKLGTVEIKQQHLKTWPHYLLPGRAKIFLLVLTGFHGIFYGKIQHPLLYYHSERWVSWFFLCVVGFFSKFTGSVDTKLLQLVLLCQWISTSSQIQDDESPSRNRKGVAVPSHPKHVPIHTDALWCCTLCVMNITLFCFPRMCN